MIKQHHPLPATPEQKKAAITSFLDGRRPQVCFILQFSQVQWHRSGKRESTPTWLYLLKLVSVKLTQLHTMDTQNHFRNSQGHIQSQ